MTPEVRKRFSQVQNGQAPEGYMKSSLGIVPAEWKEITLGDVYKERKECGNDQLPILTVSIHSGVSDGELDKDEIGKKVKRIEDKSQYKKAVKGDLVFNMMRAWQGAIGTVTNDGMVSPAYIVAEPNQKVVPAFMNYYMSTPQMVQKIHSQSYGVTDFRLRLYWDSFTPIKCCLPGIQEQQRIAEILAAQNQVIKLKEKQITEKRKQKKHLMQQLVMGKVRLPGFNQPWQTIRLHQIAERVKRRNNIGNENVLTISAQNGLINQSDFFDKEIASSDKSNYYLLHKDEFAYNKSYSKGYPLGAIKRLRAYDAGIVSPLYICFAVDKKIVSVDFMEQYFETGLMNRGIQAFAQEGARNHGLLNIAVGDFFNTKVCLPLLKEQNAIAEVLSVADREIDLLQQNLDQEKLKEKALIQLLMTGIVRVHQ